MITAVFLISIFITAFTLSSIWPGLIPVWIVFAQLFGVVVVLLFFGLMVPFYKRADSNNRFFGYLTRNLSFTLNHFILRLKVIPKGLENIPKDGKVVFLQIINHIQIHLLCYKWFIEMSRMQLKKVYISYL